MQRQANALVGTLREFINQPDYPTLVLGCDDAAVALPNRTLLSFSQEDEDHYYLLFPNPCPSAAEYVEAIAQALATQLETLNAELVRRQVEPIPPWPLEVQDARYPPAQRLQVAIEHAGKHLPGPDDIVWGLLPSEIGDPQGFKALVAPLLAPETVPPWMDRHRFIVRDCLPTALIIPELYQAKNDRVLVMELDFSNESAERELHATALDKSLAPDDRVFAFFQLAAIDFAFKRYPEALEKYGACFNYYDGKGVKSLASLCLRGAGDTMLYAGRPLDALKFFQQSIALSLQDGNLTTLQQGLHSAGSTSMDLGKNEDAEGYFKHSSDVSGKLCNPWTKCDALEKMGEAQWRQGKVGEARDSWVTGKDLAKQFGDMDHVNSMLDRLIAMYRISNRPREAAEYEQEKAQLAAEAAKTSPAKGASHGA
jgi:tetratricopeptide (TPR) repeat protein